MRLLLLPISTRRALVYCEPSSHSLPAGKQTYFDKAVNRVSSTWAKWEKAEKGWKLKTTQYGNKMLRRIPFEEWGLKSIPALRDRRKQEYAENPSKMAVDVMFPKLYQGLSKKSILDELRGLSTSRQGLHQKKMYWSIAAMPLTIPFGLLPIIPNLPFFYLAFRAYSHYRALNGSRHLSHLVTANLLRSAPDPTLDSLYSAGLLHPTRADSRNSEDPTLEQTKSITSLIRKQMRSEPVNAADVDKSPGTQGPQLELKSGGKVNGKATRSDEAETKAEPQQPGGEEEAAKEEDDEEEIMLLKKWNGKLIAERLGLPGLEVEIERAVEQVESQLQKGEEQQQQEKKEAAGQEGQKNSVKQKTG